jgi:hypothetical protein
MICLYRSVGFEDALDTPSPRNGSKPARISLIEQSNRRRAEFFALPSHASRQSSHQRFQLVCQLPGQVQHSSSKTHGPVQIA